MGEAENVTGSPAHTGLAEAAMATLTGIRGLTPMETVLEVAGLFVTQVVREEVRTQLTASLFRGV
jgi:hypothetical protein